MPNCEAEACVIVLAAGRGRRMGGPKALMQVSGQPWWRRQAEQLARCGRPVFWVVSPEVGAAMVASGDPPAHMVAGDGDRPMFASIVAGVRATLDARGPTAVHVHPIDVPAPRGETLRALELAAARASVAVPVVAGRSGHPVTLSAEWITSTLLPAAEAGPLAELRLDLLSAGVRTLVPVDAADAVVNLNTPEDLARWLAGRTGGSHPSRT